MGSWWSTPEDEDEQLDNTVTQVPRYRYPPKSGNYFSTHFIMGGERFETPQPEQYLFGENSDLNFFSGKPLPFPYPAPHSTEPTKTLKSLVNIRKETLKFTKIVPTENGSGDPPPPCSTKYNIEFVFDCDCKCMITIMYFCTEEVTPSGVIYRPREPKMNSDAIQFKAGANQTYSNSAHIFNPSLYPESDLLYDFDKEVYPIVIYCHALEGDEPKQSHVTTAIVDRQSDGGYALKPLKQKLFVDGLLYLLQEIYGIENKKITNENERDKSEDEDSDENSSAECVICMSDSRDTLILPCRHLCLCHSCADSLRYQANNCPICRAPFRALLQIRAVYRIPPTPAEYPCLTSDVPVPVMPLNSIPGYDMVPLLEALNGPYQSSAASQPTDSNLNSSSRQEAVRVLNTSSESEEPTPIAMTVMVSPSQPTLSDISEKGGDHGSPTTSCKKLPINNSSSELKSLSDPDYENNFSEDTLPNLQAFPSPTSHRSFSNEDHKASSDKGTELPLHLSRDQDHLHIAAIDEFSDEEDPSQIKDDGDTTLGSESSQSTPVRHPLERKDPAGPNYRYSRTARSTGSSLPGTPNNYCRSPGSAVGTVNSASTRSSGDSFTSSCSTKQLLPQSTPTSAKDRNAE